MNQSRRMNLVTYREIATALAYAHMNHEHRDRQLEILYGLLEEDRVKWGECDYRNTLDALIALLDALRRLHPIHSEVKSTLHLIVTLCNNALSRPESLWEERAPQTPEGRQRLEVAAEAVLITNVDDIPF